MVWFLTKNWWKVVAALWLVLIATAAPARADQVDITIPSEISFNVTDVTSSTDGSPDPLTISYDNAALSSGNELRVGIRANSTDFSSLAGETGEIPCDLLSWSITSATGFTGSAGTLSTTDTQVLISAPNPSSGSADLDFTLAAPGATGLVAGDHQLTVTWSLESV